jgi:DNA-directed RNA polymerase specialized sigma24 family protein
MPARRRQVLTLRFVYGLAQADVARRLGLSEPQVSAEIATGLCAVAARRTTPGGDA